jgi:nitrile hydratase beta subunit
MNGPQDLGGQMGFGAVSPEPNEPLFHADWEKRALGVTLAAGAMGAWTIDESRHARESLHPADYYGSSYYEIWVKALETLLVRHGFVSPGELMSGEPLESGRPAPRVLAAEAVPGVLGRGAPYDRPIETAPRFAAGDLVAARMMHPSGHTRLPRYVRGRRGRVEAVRGAFVFADTNAHGAGEAPQWMYTVVFAGRELWGEDAEPTLTLSVDAWESYLEPA